MKCFKQFLLENIPDISMFAFSPNGRFSPHKARHMESTKLPFHPVGGNEDIQGFFRITENPVVTGQHYYTGEAITFNHVGPVWNTGSQFNDDSSGAVPNPTFLHVQTSYHESPKGKGIRALISRINHKDQSDLPIHEVFLNETDNNEEHQGRSDIFAMKPDDAMDIIDEHLSTKLPHSQDLMRGVPVQDKIIDDFHHSR